MVEIAYPIVLYSLIPLFLIVSYWRFYYYKYPIYKYSSLKIFKNVYASNVDLEKKIIFFINFFTILFLILAISRLRSPDKKIILPVHGIDIELVLDVSGSMTLFDDLNDPRSRIDVAKSEALKFINKRVNDSIGIVLFAKYAVSRSPLTLDKKMLSEIINDTSIGFINPDGTVLSKGVLTALNRLKNGISKNKIIILLTDGEPSSNDIDPVEVVNIAKKMGIKIYTIGVGSKEGGFFKNDMFNIVMRTQSVLNKKLLDYFAEQTGGKSFIAENPKDLEKIYDIIDSLEKTEHKNSIFATYFEYFIPILWIVFSLIFIQLILTTYKWLII